MKELGLGFIPDDHPMLHKESHTSHGTTRKGEGGAGREGEELGCEHTKFQKKMFP